MSDIIHHSKSLLASQIEQNNFLGNLIEQNTPIFLKNGVKLQGFINGFDNQTIFLRAFLEASNIAAQVIYKRTISTISSGY